jgi:putative component of membrane protein insertase Oxa1/YidC/SpoIIIJ protein YidD
MTKNNLLVKLSVYIIRKIWHGKLGRAYNQKRNIICRFYPSCSNYAIIALEKYGFIIGWLKSINRIWRCKPSNCDSCVDYP